MAQRITAHRRGSSSFTIAAIVLIGLVGGALLLHAAGAVNIPFLSGGDDAPPPPDHTGKTKYVTTVRPVAAYARVEPAHITNPKTGEIQYVYAWKSEMPKGAAEQPNEILGRVMKHQKPAKKIFVPERDFYPKGTRPGPTAGVPEGKRAIRLLASDVPGLHGLNQGDRFDLVMTVEVEVKEPRKSRSKSVGRLDLDGPYAPIHELENAEQAELPYIVRRMAEVRVIVDNGLVVLPVHKRVEYTQESSLLRGTRLNEVPIEELIIAVSPQEVAELTQALTLGANLQVAMRTGLAGVDQANEGTIPPVERKVNELRSDLADDAENPRPARTRLYEEIEGGERRLKVVPAGNGNGGE